MGRVDESGGGLNPGATNMSAMNAGAMNAASAVAIERQVHEIAKELRCLVCQNESVADSQADLARDLRNEIRRLLRASKTDEQIREYLVDRYGDRVLYAPPWRPATWLLWLGPGLMVAGVMVWFFRTVGCASRGAVDGDSDGKYDHAHERERDSTPHAVPKQATSVSTRWVVVGVCAVVAGALCATAWLRSRYAVDTHGGPPSTLPNALPGTSKNTDAPHTREDAAQWAAIARAHKAAGRWAEAKHAYAHAVNTAYPEADWLVDYADLLVVMEGNAVGDQALALIHQALRIDPQHPIALMIAGVAAYQRAQYAMAVEKWEKLLPRLPNDLPQKKELQILIQQARKKSPIGIKAKN